MADNRVTLRGTLVETGALRYSPAGVPAVDARLRHESQQLEAGAHRRIELEVPLVALGNPALALASARSGQEVEVSGFLARRGKDSRDLVVHATQIESF